MKTKIAPTILWLLFSTIQLQGCLGLMRPQDVSVEHAKQNKMKDPLAVGREVLLNWIWDLPMAGILHQREFSPDTMAHLKAGDGPTEPAMIADTRSYANLSDDGTWYLQLHGAAVYRNSWDDDSTLHGYINNWLIRTSIVKEPFYKKHFDLLNGTERAIAIDRARSSMAIGKATNTTFDMQSPCVEHTGSPPFAKTATTDHRGAFEIDLCPCKLGPVNASLPSLLEVPVGRGHLSSLLVPSVGLTISSDVDDIVRVAKVWNFKQALALLVARPFVPSAGMPEVLHGWDQMVIGIHWHWVTDAIADTAAYYMDGMDTSYPVGSFSFRPWEIEGRAKEVGGHRYFHTRRLLESFPHRKFILMGDTTTGTVMSALPRLALEFPDQVMCVLIRDTRATEPTDWIDSDSNVFVGLPPARYFFFETAADLKNITAAHLNDLVAGTATGCFPEGLIPPQHFKPSKIRGHMIVSYFRVAFWRFQCDYLHGFFRKANTYSHACKFDRIPGQALEEKTVQHDQL